MFESKTFIIPQLYIVLDPLNLWGPARVTRYTGHILNGKRTYKEVAEAMDPGSVYGITFSNKPFKHTCSNVAKHKHLLK